MNIYVGFLPEGFNDELLRDKFAEFGEVTSAKVIKDRETGLSKGFGFVEMKNEADAKNAIQELRNWVKPDGRTVKVTEAQEKPAGFGGNRDRNNSYGSRGNNKSFSGGGKKW